MRVIAGKARHLPLKTIEGDETRPTTDRIKETLFNMINNDLYDAEFLDLFAGSGGIGIEALSRGAAGCVFVEKAKKTCECIRGNLKFTKLDGPQVQVMECDYQNALGRLEIAGRHFDIVFMDPPYNHGFEEQVLQIMKDQSIIDENTMIIIEADLNTKFDYLDDLGYDLIKVKEYKTNKHVFVQRQVREA